MGVTIRSTVIDDETGQILQVLGAHGIDLEDAVVATQDQLFALLPDRPTAA